MTIKVAGDRPAYFAGFFDGEGHVHVFEHTATGKSKWLGLGITIANTDIRPLEEGQFRWGGRIYVRRPDAKHLGSKVLYSWQIYSRVAAQFLEDIYPHLVVKKAQVELALKFQRRVNAIPGHQVRTVEEMAERYRIRDAIKALNG